MLKKNSPQQQRDQLEKTIWTGSSKPSAYIPSLGIQSPKLRMVSWNLNTFRFGGDYTPQAHHLRFGDWILRDGNWKIDHF